MDLSATPVATPCRAVALLIDGENIAASCAGPAILAARALGPLSVMRVYGDARRLGDWHEAPGFRVIHAHAGKNVTDMLLSVEAMDLSYTASIDGFALASHDRDFAPLIQSLRQRGFPVLGLFAQTAPESLRRCFTRTALLAAPPKAPAPTPPPAPVRAVTNPSDMHSAILDLLRAGILHPQAFGAEMGRRGFRKPEGVKRWQDYLATVDPRVTVTGEGETRRFALTTDP